MKNEKLKNKKSVGRPPYIENMTRLRELYLKVKNKKLTNQEAWSIARLSVRRSGIK